VCGHHGDYSASPKTKTGKDPIRAAHFKNGQETLEAKAEHSAKSLMFRYLNNIGKYVGFFISNLKHKAGYLWAMRS